jgi:hypothetical protein
MKLATIILAATLAASGSFAFAQGGAGGGTAGGPSSSGTVGSSAGSSSTGGTSGSTAGGSNTGGVSNGAGSFSAGQNSIQNPSGNSYINPPAGTAPGAGRR